MNRGHYYNARQLSSQKGSFFIKSNYDDLLKVYSIWIVICPRKEKQNSIIRYHMVEEVLLGKGYEEEKNYNKQEIIMVYLSQEESGNRLIELLKTVADRTMESEKKISILEKEYGIEINERIEKEVNSMCNYSQLIKEEGRSEGILLGETNGRIQGLFASICSLMENLKIDIYEAMRLLNIPKKDYQMFQEMLDSNH